MSGSSRKRPASISGGLWPEHPDRKKQRVPQTCEWILHDGAYQSWRNWDDSASPVLWIYGPPGIGKTFLADFILDDLASAEGAKNSTLVGCYCDATSTPSSILRTILARIVGTTQVDAAVKDQVAKVLDERSPSAVSTTSEPSFKLWDSISDVVEGAAPVTIVVDGLDELQTEYLQAQEFDFASRLVDLTAVLSGYVRVLILSRVSQHIARALGDCPKIEITEAKVHDDLVRFTGFQLAKHHNLRAISDSIQEQLVRQSEGIFLWVSLSIHALAKETSDEAVLERLDHLSGSLSSVYVKIFQRQAEELSKEQIMLRDTILRWLVFVITPLRAVAIANAVCVEKQVFVTDIEAKALDVCGPLVKVENRVLKPIHHSLREFLLSGSTELLGEDAWDASVANTAIAKTLLAYLSHPELVNINAEEIGEDFRSMHPLADYATLYWVHHASSGRLDEDLQNQIRAFFKLSTGQAGLWFDRLLPAFLPESVLPVPPRPSVNACFFHLWMLKSQIVKCFAAEERNEVDANIALTLRKTYELFLAEAEQESGPGSPAMLKRHLQLAEMYSWLPDFQENVQGLLEVIVEWSSTETSAEMVNLRIAAYQALADELKRNGKYKEAQKTLEKLLKVAESTISADDSRLVFALDSLGWVCMRLGELEAASGFLHKALDIAATCFGSQSSFTLRSRVTLAEVLGKLGRHSEAEELCAELKKQLKQHSTDGTPLSKDSISQVNTLAAIYMQEGKFEDARATYQIVVDDRRNVFGSDHRLTLWAEMQLGFAIKQAGDRKEAKELLQALLPRQTKVLGQDHPDVKSVTETINELSSDV